jgi:DNA-directed RNA polymerase subunit RPC12/RpoP
MWNTKIELPSDDGKVISLEVRRESIYGRRLRKTCPHGRALIDTALAMVICQDCGKELNPIEHLASLAEEWARIERLYEMYRQEKEAVETRKKVKCRHCGHFTNIR